MDREEMYSERGREDDQGRWKRLQHNGAFHQTCMRHNVSDGAFNNSSVAMSGTHQSLSFRRHRISISHAISASLLALKMAVSLVHADAITVLHISLSIATYGNRR